LIIQGLRELFDGLAKHPSLQSVLASVRKPGPVQLHLSGLGPTAQALYTALLYKWTDRPVLFLTATNSSAESFAESIGAFFELLDFPGHRGAPFVLPAHDVTPYDALSPHADILEKRGIGLWRMAEGEASVVVAPAAGVLLRVAPRNLLQNLAWRIEVGDEFFQEDLLEGLVSVGYRRHEPVDMMGQFSVRGGILDVFSPEAANPVRIELFGDQVESIREFDPETQKSIRSADQASLLPLTEYPVPRRPRSGAAGSTPPPDFDNPAGEIPILPQGWEFSPEIARQRTTGLLGLLDDPILVWSETAGLREQADQWWTNLEAARERLGPESPRPEEYYLRWPEFVQQADAVQQIHLEQLGLDPAQDRLEIPTQRTPRFQGNIAHCVRELQAQVKSGYRALVVASSLGDVERLAEVFSEFGVTYQLGLKDPSKVSSPYLEEKAYLAGPISSTVLVQGAIREGAVFPDSRTILYGSEDLFTASEMVARPEKRKSAVSTFLSDLQDLKENDFVVHAEHGVGRYLGLRQIERAGRQEDLMLIEYAERAKLYVPLTRLDLVQKYHGAGGPPPQLDRLGGQTWQRTKSRVKARLVDMADELLKLYAQRKLADGFAFSADGNWQREFEDAFAYTETPDQLQSIADIKRDMESEQTMDRLVCGDVGFGKTEVAMRAAFKALCDDKQVAVLSPTTVLAFQHFETFRQRFASFPIEVEMLTRFRTAAEVKQALERLAAGKVDVVIGTHRLLSQDVVFNDLGLLIVDEEQRFGVRHKERIKQLRKNVDVVTLTATPIPRTLHMSLVGLRDISIIQTPPKDRLSIHTVVAPFSDQIVRAALLQELGRGGQIYFIHNRIENIWKIAAHLQQLAPGIRIGVGHGQMAGKDLEGVMLKFMRHDYDMLVSTTIVENGLDIPLANTIIVNHADQYGLAELYQLRGRVGRSNRRAYAYLLVPEDKELSEVARKRLAALKEFSELGSGFKIAALDLELRGAGNLLGSQQHGHIAAVGFETYCRMLEDSVRELRGEEVEPEVRTALRLQVDIHIPPEYIADEAQRLQAYKRVAEIRDPDARQRVTAELQDRYGPLPRPVSNLADYALLKSRAEAMRVEAIERRAKRLSVRFREDSKVDAQTLLQFVAETADASFSPSGELQWGPAPETDTELLAAVRDVLERLAGPAAPEAPPDNGRAAKTRQRARPRGG
jgi:transcription-repair coupling factor (superfamily II helicase)